MAINLEKNFINRAKHSFSTISANQKRAKKNMLKNSD